MAAPGRVKTVAGAIGVFLGVLLLVVTIAIPTYIVPQLKKTPLDLDITTVAESEPEPDATGDAKRFPATILDRCSLNERRAKNLSARITGQRRVLVVDPSNRKTMTVEAAQAVIIDEYLKNGRAVKPSVAGIGETGTCSDGLLSATIDRTTIDRVSSLSRPADGQSSVQVREATTDDDPGVVDLPERSGLQYKFPLDTRANRNYAYFDLNSRTKNPLTSVDESEINGVKVIHFTQDVPPADLSQLAQPDPNADEPAIGTLLTMPARWWGLRVSRANRTKPVTMVRYVETTRDLWVEPKTGTIVKGSERVHQYYALAEGATNRLVPKGFTLTALKATLTFNDETQRLQAANAKKYGDQITFGTRTLPILVGVIGGLLLLVGAVLLFLGGRASRLASPSGPTTSEPEDTRRTAGDLAQGAPLVRPRSSEGFAYSPPDRTMPAPTQSANDAEPYSTSRERPYSAPRDLYDDYPTARPGIERPYGIAYGDTGSLPPVPDQSPDIVEQADINDYEHWTPESDQSDDYSPHNNPPADWPSGDQNPDDRR